MKKLLSLFFLGILSLSCSSDHDTQSTLPSGLTNSPEANAAYDGNNYGIYKGVFAGSSGTAYINILNDGYIIAVLNIDGVEYRYSTSEAQIVTLNNDISGLTFKNDVSQFDFNVGGDGKNATITELYIQDHPHAAISIVKEKSNSLVRCYQGTVNKEGSEDTPTFNLLISNGKVQGLLADAFTVKDLRGTEANKAITGQVVDENIEFSGVINPNNENNISGIWHNTQDPSDYGTWQGIRKL